MYFYISFSFYVIGKYILTHLLTYTYDKVRNKINNERAKFVANTKANLKKLNMV